MNEFTPSYSNMLELSELILRLGVAILCGFIIGLERQIHKGLAGIHTNVLVSSGSCLFIFVGLCLNDQNSPARVASQIVSGIGFLGAGVVIKEGMTVRGINSAATLWCSAAIGSLCGGGMLGIGVLSTTIITAVNSMMRHKWIKQIYKKTAYNLVIQCTIDSVNDVLQYVESKSANILLNKFQVHYFGGSCEIGVHIIDFENTLNSRKVYVQELAQKVSGIQTCTIEIA